MSKASVKIENYGGPLTKVTVNGLDISNCTTSYNLDQRANDLPHLTIALQMPITFEGAAEVAIPDQTRAALIALGWTAPPETKEE